MAAVLLLGISAAAFAQATFTVGSIPVTAVTDSGQTEKTGDITITSIPGSAATVPGTITISFGVPITIGMGAITSTDPNVTVNNINNQAGQLVLNVAGAVPTIAAVVSGVRVATAGSPLTSLSASISTTGNALVAGQTNVTVINAISPGIASFGLSSPIAQPSTINAVTGAATNGIYYVKEGFLNAFGVTAATDPTQTGSNLIRITLSQAPPPGVSMTFPQVVDTVNTTNPGPPPVVTAGAFELSDGAGALLGADLVIDDEGPLTFYYKLVIDSDLTVVETILIDPVVAVAPGTPKPLPSTTITATVTLAPIGPAFGTLGTVLATPIPRYAASEVGPATLLRIVPASTTLLFPYVTTAFGYDTGIAISNTTMDPKGVMGVDDATAQDGAITFYFYPSGGTPFNLPVGTLDSGDTYTELLSNLLAEAQQPVDFTGYIIAVCEFTNAHGQYFISDFMYFTNGALALVVHDDRDNTPEALNQ